MPPPRSALLKMIMRSASEGEIIVRVPKWADSMFQAYVTMTAWRRVSSRTVNKNERAPPPIFFERGGDFISCASTAEKKIMRHIKYTPGVRMQPLVEPRTFMRMCALRSRLEKKNNGENMVRVILIIVVFFLLLQAMYHTQQLANEEKQGKPVRHAFPMTAGAGPRVGPWGQM